MVEGRSIVFDQVMLVFRGRVPRRGAPDTVSSCETKSAYAGMTTSMPGCASPAQKDSISYPVGARQGRGVFVQASPRPR